MRLQTLSITTELPNQWVAVQAAMTELVNQLGQHVPSATLSSIDMDVDRPDDEFFDDRTMFKVYDTIHAVVSDADMTREIITELQNAGVLFRERAVTTDDNGSRAQTAAV